MPSIPTVPFTRQDEKRLSFEMVSLHNNRLDQPDDHHRHDFYSMVLLEQGESIHKVDFITYTIEAAQVLIIPKDSVHFGSFDKKLKGYLILFAADFFDPAFTDSWQYLTIFNPLYEKALISFTSPEWQSILLHLELLATQYQAITSTITQKVVQHLLLALLLKLEEKNKTFLSLKSTPTDSYYQNFFSLLDAYYRKQHDVGFYASALNISSKKLSNILTGKSGKSTADFITERLLLEAKRLLTYTHQSVKEIAYDLGFNDPFYFSRLFKKKIGLSPEQFRLGMAQKSI